MPAAAAPSSTPESVRVTEPSLLARWLGHAGLIPSMAGALLVWLVRAEAHPYVALALACFIGAAGS